MQLFKKKTTLKDHYFLKLSLSKLEKSKIQSFLDDEEDKRFFPQITFENAEKIFNELAKKLDAEETFLISKMELVLNQEGVTSTEDELFLTDFEIANDYENVLKPLSEAMFNLMPFSAVPFEEKLNYLKEIFEAWQESSGLGNEHLPLLPDFEWDDEEYVEFIIPFYQNQKNTKEENQEVEEVEKEETGAAEVLVEKGGAPETQEVEEKETSKNITEIAEKQINKAHNHENIEKEEIVKKVSPPLISRKEQIDFKPYSFTYFQLKTTSPDFFVPIPISEKIETINKEIDQFNQESKTLQKSIFERKMAYFEVEKKNQLAISLKKQDKRVQLKNKLVYTAAQKLQEALDFESKRAKDKEKLALLEERKAYELRVETIKHEASLALEEKLKQIKNESKNQVHNELSNVLSNETAQLRAFLGEALLDLQIERKKEADNVREELYHLSEVQQKALEVYYKQNLALPLNIQLQPLLNLEEVNSGVEQFHTPNFSHSHFLLDELGDLPKATSLDPKAGISPPSQGEIKNKVAQEHVQEVTQQNTHIDTQEKAYENTQIQENLNETPGHTTSKGAVLSFLQYQYKQNRLLTLVAFVVVIAIGLLSFSGGWVLFNNFTK
ncbi:hypothetical protein RCG33_09240 [Lactococcus lactis]|jgi:hypothetical protein|uniref:Uncharacterized protein n=2 Tax=Lactococcus lactis subsp. lactis TaxID=1360 RepID=S6EZD3_LACLL|nr:hypothetical protein [Lactococcus lactis]MDN6242472.1 hypothetical protein [Tetragenococcus koreensis]ARE21586.1 hypothetical protein LLUC06_2044 [Lactococcus lactis subsp. lactis]MDN5424651.1 hypothetical protein [Lactococcus lactis]MDN6009759.1 hypothetical protein [Lactococcus lactis]MDN6218831.1 hypothetical protein [Lactococcus lactis]